MSAMEKSLRKALESGDSTDPGFRESIYSASERALERMLAQKEVGEEVAHAQRTRLAETINRVEDEFYARQTEEGSAQDGPAQHDPELSLDPAYADVHAYGAHPGGDEGSGPSSDRDDEDEDFQLRPVFEEREGRASSSAVAMAVGPAGGGSGGDEVSERVRPSPRTRGDEAARKAAGRGGAQSSRVVLIFVLALAALCLALYLVYAADGAGRSGSAADAGWIGLFDGRRLDALATPDGGRLEALEADGAEPSVRFTPSDDASNMEVAVGAGVISQLDGRAATVEIVAGSPDGAVRTFSVECRLGGVSVCGRKVFATSRSSESFAFRMNVPAEAGAGSIAIAFVPGSMEEGIDLFSMRVRNG